MNRPQPSAPLRLLLVDDNEPDVRAFRRAFETAHVCCEITHCVRAEEALERLRLHAVSFDLLVTDYTLSGMSGSGRDPQFLTALKLQMTFCPLYLATCSSDPRTVRPERATVSAHLPRVFARCAQLQRPGRR